MNLALFDFDCTITTRDVYRLCSTARRVARGAGWSCWPAIPAMSTAVSSDWIRQIAALVTFAGAIGAVRRRRLALRARRIPRLLRPEAWQGSLASRAGYRIVGYPRDGCVSRPCAARKARVVCNQPPRARRLTGSSRAMMAQRRQGAAPRTLLDIADYPACTPTATRVPTKHVALAPGAGIAGRNSAGAARGIPTSSCGIRRVYLCGRARTADRRGTRSSCWCARARLMLPGGGSTTAIRGAGRLSRNSRGSACAWNWGANSCLRRTRFRRSEQRHYRKRGRFFVARIVGGAPPTEDDHEMAWLETTDALSQLVYGSHRWALERFLQTR